MEIVEFALAPFYTAPNHDGVTSRRLQGGEASRADFAWVAYSDFPAGVVVPMDTGIFIAAGEARSIINDSGQPAAIIVVTPAPTKSDG
jgi:hypothetical protein